MRSENALVLEDVKIDYGVRPVLKSSYKIMDKKSRKTATVLHHKSIKRTSVGLSN